MPSQPFDPLIRTAPDLLGDAYQRWKSVRARLAHTIQDYVDACNTLDTALSRHSGQKSLEQTLVGLDTELSGLEQDYERLSQTHVVLSRHRNQSKELAPINRLPAEILSQIFRFAVCLCPHQLRNMTVAKPYIYPDALAGVCSAWRRAAVNLPSLWSHIDLTINATNTDNYYQCARIWSERAKNTPLDLHIRPIDNTPAIDEPQVLELLAFLASLAEKIRSLDVFCDCSTEHLGHRILACWTKHGSPRVAQALKLGSWDSKLVGSPVWDSTAIEGASLAQIEDFFYSLQSLDFIAFHVPWESKIYHGLVRLSLEGIPLGVSYQLTQPQLATVLRSSPQLQELKLADVLVLPQGWVEQEPIVLKELEALVVHESLALVLPLIAPGSKPLRLGILVDDDPKSLEVTRAFFSRSVIETLDIADFPETEHWFQFVLGPFEHLKTLIITDCNFTSRTLQDLLTKIANEHLVPWPGLQTLLLAECRLRGETLLKLLSMHSVQTLELHSCRAADGESKEHMLKLKDLLSSVVPDTTLNYDSDNDPANSYLC
ncbi:hypothetical protein BDV93DRAFT_521709 [Ceratobasidium sp. AG-I]|nr:hypothetical protein BDV93DRAFT_521709 [Ceratobasidium sp. AG-I]